MPIDRSLALAALIGLASSASAAGPDGRPYMGGPDNFGEANRQTMAAQIIDPAPVYDNPVPESRGDHTARVIERYRVNRVKQPRSGTARAFSNTSTGTAPQ